MSIGTDASAVPGKELKNTADEPRRPIFNQTANSSMCEDYYLESIKHTGSIPVVSTNLKMHDSSPQLSCILFLFDSCIKTSLLYIKVLWADKQQSI